MARRMMGEVLPDDVHFSMFVPNIQSMCSEEQQAHWLPRIEAGEVVGCYAQTELSHGSNVRALRMTATYLRGSDEIEIHTPDLEVRLLVGAICVSPPPTLCVAQPRSG